LVNVSVANEKWSGTDLWSLIGSRLVEIKMVQISEQFVQKARIELGETDERRQECLVEFRDWIAAHPFIKDCRQGI